MNIYAFVGVLIKGVFLSLTRQFLNIPRWVTLKCSWHRTKSNRVLPLENPLLTTRNVQDLFPAT